MESVRCSSELSVSVPGSARLSDVNGNCVCMRGAQILLLLLLFISGRVGAIKFGIGVRFGNKRINCLPGTVVSQAGFRARPSLNNFLPIWCIANKHTIGQRVYIILSGSAVSLHMCMCD